MTMPVEKNWPEYEPFAKLVELRLHREAYILELEERERLLEERAEKAEQRAKAAVDICLEYASTQRQAGAEGSFQAADVAEHLAGRIAALDAGASA